MVSKTSKSWIRNTLIVSVIAGVLWFNFAGTEKSTPTINYSDAAALVESKSVKSAQYIESTGELTMDLSKSTPVNVLDSNGNPETERTSQEKVRVTIFNDGGKLLSSVAANASLTVKDRPLPSLLSKILWVILPIILLVGLFALLSKKASKGTSQLFGFSKSKIQMVDPEKNKVRFDDVAGCDEAKEEVKEFKDFLQDPEKFSRLGGNLPRGALLVGPPGTGKTLLAKALAGESKVPFFYVSGSDFVEMFVGVGQSRVKDMFEQARKNAPCIIFIDEVDSLAGKRSEGAHGGGGNDEREQTLNQLLVQMDGMQSNDNIVVLAATNRADKLDPAVRRPGRFTREINVGLPDRLGRLAILKVHGAKVALDDNVDLEKIAMGTRGFSGADLGNLLNEAALIAVRDDSKLVSQQHLVKARDRVILGAEKLSALKNPKEQEITAYHEAGHAIVAHYSPKSDPVYKISIVPRRNSLGVTMQLPDEDATNADKESLYSRIRVLMGGRAAEQVALNIQTVGASNDFAVATRLARTAIGSWGLDDELGPFSYDGEDGVIRGLDNGLSEATKRELDLKVRSILKQHYKEAMDMLHEHRSLLEMVTAKLLEVEDMDGDMFMDLVKKYENNEFTQEDATQKLLIVEKSLENLS